MLRENAMKQLVLFILLFSLLLVACSPVAPITPAHGPNTAQTDVPVPTRTLPVTTDTPTRMPTIGVPTSTFTAIPTMPMSVRTATAIKPTATKLPSTPTAAPTKRLATFTAVPAAPVSSSNQALVSLTSPIAHGADARISVRTSAGARCSIAVYYKSGKSTAQGLEAKTAGNDGLCIWGWKVGTNTTPGTWRIVVTTGTTSREYPFVVQ